MRVNSNNPPIALSSAQGTLGYFSQSLAPSEDTVDGADFALTQINTLILLRLHVVPVRLFRFRLALIKSATPGSLLLLPI
jgi:hypothetical protein